MSNPINEGREPEETFRTDHPPTTRGVIRSDRGEWDPSEGGDAGHHEPVAGRGLASSALDRPLLIVSLLGILVAVILTMALQRGAQDAAVEAAGVGPEIRVMELLSRYAVGTRLLVGEREADSLTELLAQIEGGDLEQRLRYIPVEAELLGPEAALMTLESLREIVAGAALSEEQRVDADETLDRMADVLDLRMLGIGGIGGIGDAPIPDDADTRLLHERLGWFGELLTSPPGDSGPERAAIERSTQRFVIVAASLMIGVALLGVVGFLGAIAVIVLSGLGTWRWFFDAGPARWGVWIETAVVWLALLTGAMVLLALVVPEHLGLTASLGAFALSAVAIVWPRLRGFSWKRVRSEVGLHCGRGVLIECACGVATYVLTLPLLVLGLLGTLLLTHLSSSATAAPEGVDALVREQVPSHPVLEMIAAGSPFERLQVLLLACVAAPVIEELLFRGALYRGFRGSTRRVGRLFSAIASAVIVGVIFAAIHPQGAVAIPALTAIACGFALGREWRDSLIAPMVAHAINNGLLIGVMIVAFS